MKTKEKTLKGVINEMYENFELARRDDGTNFYRTKKTIDWQRDIIFNAHQDRMPNDDCYDRIHSILCDLINIDDDATRDDAIDYVLQSDYVDCYTYDLTKWLNDDNRNVYYLTQAISEHGATDGFNALQTAQYIYINEIAYALIDGIDEYLQEIN